MTRRRKHVLVLLGGQTVCLITGWWMQTRFMAASMATLGQPPTGGAATSVLDAVSGAALAAFLCMGILLSITGYLILAPMHDQLDRNEARNLTDTLRQTQDLLRTRDAVIFGLAKLADSRDPETGCHLERIAAYSKLLATALSRQPKYRDVITPAFIRMIGLSSALHDIGKVGISDSILRKPGPLTPEERAEMQRHATIGGECLRQIERRLGNSNFLQMAREIAWAHHERWDGTGYPLGLSGEKIPLAARIVAIADVYDALVSKRVYKPARPHDECVRTIRDNAGQHFDPDMVEVWLGIHERFREIARENAQPDQEGQAPLHWVDTEHAHEGAEAVAAMCG